MVKKRASKKKKPTVRELLTRIDDLKQDARRDKKELQTLHARLDRIGAFTTTMFDMVECVYGFARAGMLEDAFKTVAQIRSARHSWAFHKLNDSFMTIPEVPRDFTPVPSEPDEDA